MPMTPLASGHLYREAICKRVGAAAASLGSSAPLGSLPALSGITRLLSAKSAMAFFRSATCSSLGSVRWSPCFDVMNSGGANKRDELLRDFEHARLLIAIAIGIV